MAPFLLMILHFSQIGFTEDLTFTSFHSFRKKSVYHYNTNISILQVLFWGIFHVFPHFSRGYELWGTMAALSSWRPGLLMDAGGRGRNSFCITQRSAEHSLSPEQRVSPAKLSRRFCVASMRHYPLQKRAHPQRSVFFFIGNFEISYKEKKEPPHSCDSPVASINV